jgi:glycosyltransferase involved in cell wall biosynthesis
LGTVPTKETPRDAGRRAACSGPPLVVFSDDWGRHPSSCQHLIRNLLREHRVTWVNTIGMKVPTLSWSTWVRGVEKLRAWFLPGQAAGAKPTPASPGSGEADGNPRVLSPLMWPWIRTAFDRGLNCRLLERALRRNIPELDASVLVTTIPIVADVIDRLPFSRRVYYCVDDFSQWPGLDQQTLGRMEQRVIEKCDVLIAAGESLQRRLERIESDAGRGRPVHLLTHGVDLARWQAGASAAPNPLQGLEPPLVLFWGLIDRRMDVSWLRALSEAMPSGTIALVGPENDPDPALAGIARVRRLGAVPFETLPVCAEAAQVLVMPYADLPVTRAMQPLKLLEYLATGRPVVVADLPAVRAWHDALDVATTAAEFASQVLKRLDGVLPASQAAARRRLAQEDWSAKARRFAELAIGSVGT